MSRWHNVELFTLSPSVRSKYSVRTSANWQAEFKCCTVFTVPILPVFAYYSDVILWDNSGALAIWNISITDYVVVALLRSLAGACGGAVGDACPNSRMGGNGRGVLVQLPSVVCHEDYDIDVPQIICGNVSDPVSFFVAHRRPFQVDSALV